MKTFARSNWLVLTAILPAVLFQIIYWSQYHVLQPVLEDKVRTQWNIHGWIMVAVGGLALVRWLVSIRLKLSMTKWDAIAMIILPICYLAFYMHHTRDLIPWGIPRYLISENMELLPYTFLLPMILHGMLLMVHRFTPKAGEHTAWQSGIGALAVPLLVYLTFQIGFYFGDIFHRDIATYVGTVLAATVVVIFLFFLCRWVYILAARRDDPSRTARGIYLFLVGITLPIIGLMVNNGDFKRHGSGVEFFGDFSSPWFYVITLINGIVLLMPPPESPKRRLWHFLAKCVTFPFTLYFFLVFLPYLPLSIAAIIAVGVGFLMLAPIGLMAAHGLQLVKDFGALSGQFAKRQLRIWSAVAMLVIPAGLTINFYHQRVVIHDAIDYVFEPSFNRSLSERPDPETTLGVLNKMMSEDQWRWRTGRSNLKHVPYLDAYFKWLVLDNLNLSTAKYELIEAVMKGQTLLENQQAMWEMSGKEDVLITGHAIDSEYHPEQDAWLTTLHLEMTNQRGRQEEYRTHFDLPAGCYITDYYLDIEGERVPGILAEKKSAKWIYQQIRGVNRDPGILYYKEGDRVGFRIFPFTANQQRTTGITFWHKERTVLNIDGHEFTLGVQGVQQPVSGMVNVGTGSYLSREFKESLPTHELQSRLHFIIDGSVLPNDPNDQFIKRIQQVEQEYASELHPSTYEWVNSKVTPINNPEAIKTQRREGGFFLQRALEFLCYDVISDSAKSRPIPIVVTDDPHSAIFTKNLSNFKLGAASMDYFYVLQMDGQLETHSLWDSPRKILDGPQLKDNLNASVKVLMGENRNWTIRDNDQPSMLVYNENYHAQEQDTTDSWNSAAQQYSANVHHRWHPESTSRDWLPLVRRSFNSSIMMPVTSFISLENEAQRRRLLQKQKEVLNGKKSLDIENVEREMPEPSFWVVLICLFIWLGYMHRAKVMAFIRSLS